MEINANEVVLLNSASGKRTLLVNTKFKSLEIMSGNRSNEGRVAIAKIDGAEDMHSIICGNGFFTGEEYFASKFEDVKGEAVALWNRIQELN